MGSESTEGLVVKGRRPERSRRLLLTRWLAWALWGYSMTILYTKLALMQHR
jgi:hypothetical protein